VDDRARQAAWLREIAALDVERFDDLRTTDATLAQAVELVPHDTDVVVKHAHVLTRLGRMDELPPILKHAVSAGASLPPDLLLIHGDALLLAGERDTARAYFETVTAATEPRPSGNADMTTLKNLDLIAN